MTYKSIDEHRPLHLDASLWIVQPTPMRRLPDSWQAVVGEQLCQPYYHRLSGFLEEERKTKIVYPPESEVFRALELVSFQDVRVLILGQDPYHGQGQAHGLSFSVKYPAKVPPSLRNIFKELQQDMGVEPPNHGDLSAWAKQGVLLLNAVLTVQQGKPASHAGKGWEVFTDSIIRALNARAEPLVFCFWGAFARKKAVLVDEKRHGLVQSAHPSPLSQRMFFGSRPFSTINEALKQWKMAPIDWTIPSFHFPP